MEGIGDGSMFYPLNETEGTYPPPYSLSNPPVLPAATEQGLPEEECGYFSAGRPASASDRADAANDWVQDHSEDGTDRGSRLIRRVSGDLPSAAQTGLGNLAIEPSRPRNFADPEGNNALHENRGAEVDLSDEESMDAGWENLRRSFPSGESAFQSIDDLLAHGELADDAPDAEFSAEILAMSSLGEAAVKSLAMRTDKQAVLRIIERSRSIRDEPASFTLEHWANIAEVDPEEIMETGYSYLKEGFTHRAEICFTAALQAGHPDAESALRSTRANLPRPPFER